MPAAPQMKDTSNGYVMPAAPQMKDISDGYVMPTAPQKEDQSRSPRGSTTDEEQETDSKGSTTDEGEEQRNRIADYDEKMSSLYDGVANESLAHKHCMGYNLKAAIGNVKGQVCMDAACGNGAYMQYIYDKGALNVVGVDLSLENLQVCRESHKAKEIPDAVMSYIQADLGELTLYKGGPFDLAIMGCCICYCSTQEQLLAWLRNMYNNIKPGGRFVCLNTRGALPAAKQEELERKFNISYLTEAEGGSKSFSPAFVRFPNGWQTDYFFLEANTIHDAMLEVGFKVERRAMTADPEYKGDEDLTRLVELMPYDLFVAAREE